MENTLENMKQRKVNYQFKVLYAIGIFFVVAGHARADDFIFWNELIHVAGFHMALFVFASGYFYSAGSEETPGAYIVKKTKRLLVPYLLWNLFYGILVWILFKCGYTIGINSPEKPVIWQQFFYDPFTVGPHFSFNVPSWFVLPLFVTEVLNVLIRFPFRKIQGFWKETVFLALSILTGFAGIIVANKGYNHDFGLLLTRVMYFTPFFTLGYFYKLYLEKKDTLSSFWYFTIIVLIEILYILVNGASPVYSIIGMYNFENPFLPYFMGLVGIAFWLRVSRILAPAIGKSKYLNAVADNTFSIMTNHELGFFVLNTLFYIAISVTHISSLKFDVEKYKSAVEYIFLPRGRGFPLVYVVFGICFSILLQKLIVFIKDTALSKIGDKNGR